MFEAMQGRGIVVHNPRRPYQRPRPYQPPPSNKIRRTITRSVIISMCSSYGVRYVLQR